MDHKQLDGVNGKE